MVVKTEIAKPLYYQKLEKSLDIAPFLTYVEDFLKQPLGEDGEASSDSDTELAGVDAYTGETVWNGITATKEDRIADKKRLYNLSNVSLDRQWLVDVLLTDTSDSSDDEEITEEDLQDMLREHVLRNKYKKKFYHNPKNQDYMYYGTGLLSNFDKYPEHQSSSSGFVKKKKFVFQKKEKLKKQEQPSENFNVDRKKRKIKEEPDLQIMSRSKKEINHRKKSAQNKAAEIMAHRRRKIWANMAKKEIGKVQRYRISNHKEILTACRRAATNCMRHCRQRAMQSQKNMKEVIWRAKRLTREMQVYWKRFERVERETRRRMEKEAEEQRKLDVELMEAKRQQRKLNFLITQTELYAHFMSRKLGGGTTEDQLRILSQLEEEANPRLLPLDDYDCEAEKEKVRKKVEKVFFLEEARAREFGVSQKMEDNGDVGEDKPQPQIFRGTLKGYQIKGMTWLVNLYDQGINGILADEMGLGKTVQSIAFLCHIAEKYSVWGPFLIISPASTLHNWQQEMQRFVPDFKVVPYWGNQQERKILRQFWDQKGLHTKDASFHVVITSYQLVITDIKYFNRIKWQYLILDEAQAIKSTTSMRWKLLLGFNCRNRLLLSGTPIQNSMAELWALLHFIMPSMFDSHDEFNEWFSKDIESHAEHKTSIDEKHLSRLHMILKPFMLRRVKTDVENELSDKIEIMVYCPLTTRQKMLYSAVKKKIRIEDLLHSSGSSYQSAQSITSNLMNLVMQFRKVCNHPELFERREPRSPFAMTTDDYIVPALVTDAMFPCDKLHLLMNHLSPFNPIHSHRSLFSGGESERDCAFSFTRLLRISVGELYKLMFYGIYYRWHNIIARMQDAGRRKLVGIIEDRNYPSDLVFTTYSNQVFSHSTIRIESMPETIEHRIIRSKKVKLECSGEDGANLLPLFTHLVRKPRILTCQPVYLPAFLFTPTVKVEIKKSRRLYSWNRRWSWLSSRLWGEGGGQWLVLWEGEKQEPSFQCPPPVGLLSLRPITGWSSIVIPDKQTLVTDAGKLYVLDGLLTRLKEQGHRALIYSQMTRMIDLLEEYMWYRKHTYMRLDGSSKISDRRDMVADFQTREDIFVFLLSTRAGGLGINLTAADTVIFYDSDWNPTVDQQAMDRAHRLGQTKQVTVYRLICKGTIEERILQRAQEKSEIQRVVISGGNFKPDTLKPKEVVSLLLDDAEIEQKYRQKQAERRQLEESRQDIYRERERKRKNALGNYKDTVKHMKTEDGVIEVYQGVKSPAESPKGADVMKSSQDSNDNTDQEDPASQTPPKISRPFMPDRVRSRRGRPPRNCHRGNSSRPVSVANMPPIALSNRSNRRGPGRPRLRPVGPGHIGSRGPRGMRGPGRKPSVPALSIRPNQAPSQLPLQNHQPQIKVENSS